MIYPLSIVRRLGEAEILSKVLHAELRKIVSPSPSLASEVIARQRLFAVADCSPLMLELLAGDLSCPDLFETLADCARIHLYARILDDAIDVNLPVHRRHLLLAQPMLWGAISRLAVQHPGLQEESFCLIEETVKGTLADDASIDVSSWGRKNHHLLLIPLLLSGNDPRYQRCRGTLSRCIWLLQVGDEWRQGRLNQVLGHFLDELTVFLASPDFVLLVECGWRELAERCLEEGRRILGALGAGIGVDGYEGN